MYHIHVKSGYVISDLHLFSRRTKAGHYMARLHRALSGGDFLVLNGDIFDFRWSTHGTTETGIRAAIDWLRTLVTEHPHCRFFYVMGNHDGLREFALELDRLSESTDNLRWHPTHIRIGSALFLHGDLPLRTGELAPDDRALHAGVTPNKRFLNLCYDVIVALRVHRLASFLYAPRRYAGKVYASLRERNDALTDGLTDVYLGHSHLPFSDFSYGGLTFHNTGSTIRGLESNMLKVEPRHAEADAGAA